MGIWTPQQRAAFGLRLAKARNDRGMTQDEVAAACDDWGVSGKGTVSAWEKGRTMPSAMQVAILAAEYRVSVEWLVTGADPWPFGAEAPRADVAALPQDLMLQAKGMLRALIAQAGQAEGQPSKRKSAGA